MRKTYLFISGVVAALFLAACGGGGVTPSSSTPAQNSNNVSPQSCVYVGAGGNIYYVSPTGNDTNLGTLTSPFRTLQRAANVALAGETIYLRGGTYNENNISFPNCGSASQPITVTRYQNEVPVIAGGTGGPVFDLVAEWIVLDQLTLTGGTPASVRLGYNGSAQNITIQYCDISGWHGNDNNGGIYVESESHPDNIVIQRNLIHDHQAVSLTGAAGVIIFQARGMTIRNNEFTNASRGIYYKHSHDDPSITLVENNYFHDNAGGAILWSRRNGIIRNNVIRDNNSYSIRIFEEAATCDRLLSDSNQILHNTIVHTPTPINLNREGSEDCPGAIQTTVRDNLVYDWSSNEYQGLGVFVYNWNNMGWSGLYDGQTYADHNLLYASINATPIKINSTSYSVGSAPLTVNSANISQAPTFVDYANRAVALSNLALASGSPGENAASDGTDMGADVTRVGVGAP